MDPDKFNATDPLVDKLADLVDQALLSEQFADLRKTLDELNKVVGPRYSASLNVTVDIFDRERTMSLPLLNTGLSATDDGPPYRTWADSSPQRYLVKGEIQVVPHDRCPSCWEYWDFKFENHTCQHCSTTLGQDCKVLLDSDVCPHCEQGRVSMAKPICDACGYKVDLNLVTWG